MERSIEDLRREWEVVRERLSVLSSEIQHLQRRTEQLSMLQHEELDTDIRIKRLERILDFEPAAGHLRNSVMRADLVESPVPHLVLSDLLPLDVYETLIEAIPARVLFDDEATQGHELRVPPRLAPTHSIVTWMFLTDLVLRVLSPALVQRCREPLTALTGRLFPTLPPFSDWGVEVTLSQGRIIRRTAGNAEAAVPERPWDFVTAVVFLGRSHDSEEFGSRLVPKDIPFRANTALAFVGAAQAHEYISIPHAAAADTERYTYEFGIGPTKEGRRTLAAMMKKG